MAKQYDARYSATQVGSYFVKQYYKVFLQQRDSLYRFYTDESCVIRVDGKISHAASNKAQIHELIMSLNLVEIEIKTVNSLESLNGGVLVVVSGFAMPRDFSGQRKFLQTFFLAPQEDGYFVLNDMFHFADDEVVHQPSAPEMQEQNVDYQPTISTHLPEDPLVPDSTNALEEVKDCVNSLHIEGGKLVEEFNYQKQLQPETEPEPEPETNPEPETKPEPELKLQPEPELQPEPQSEHIQELEGDSLEEKTPVEEPTSLLKNNEISVLESHAEEPVKQSVKQTYASILMSKGKSPPPTSSQRSFTQNTPCVVDVNHVSHPLLQQVRPSLPNASLIGVEEPLSSGEGESKSVFVKNLPSTVTSLDILCEFKNFGKIKHDAVFLRNRKDTGACYAFMEFEDVQSALNAIKASPIQLGGRRVYIEQKKSKVGSSRSGISGGRDSGGLGGRTPGRQNEQICNGNEVRTNGFR